MRRQHGIALITAIILVALAAVLATAIGFGAAMSARRATTAFGADQSLLAAEGVEAMAAYLLKQTSSAGATAYTPDQPWAQPYGPYELADGVTLELAQLEDEQGKFNINDLAPTGTTDDGALQVFERLLVAVGLETKWAPLIADWIDVDNQPNSNGGAEDSVYLSQTPPYRPYNQPITSISELLAMPGFGRTRYDRLAPYITALPVAAGATAINICTASGVLLDALANNNSYAMIDLAAERKQANGCFPPQSGFKVATSSAGEAAGSVSIGTTTSYFRLRTFITIGTARFTLYSLMFNDTSGIRPILRTFGTE
jgi:general secretion pathway protein K